MGEESPTCVGRRDPAPVAIQQRLVELRFELAHLMAQRGLSDGEQRRSLGEAAQIGDVHEVIELFDIHCLLNSGAAELSI